MDITERFLKYVSFPTMSDENSETSPSTKKQLALSAYLVDELKAIGITDAKLDEYGYVYATVPANCDKKLPTVGLIAHVDTSDAASDTNIKPAIIDYKGGDILLNPEKQIYMRTEAYPYLEKFAGQKLIVTDGTTLLGADDKAGVAEIVTAAEKLLKTDKPHGKVRIAFTPDEEVGRGTEHFDVPGFGADYGYTVDGDFLGGLEYENFNAASAKVTVHGISIHPGSAKDKMVNAQLVAIEFNSMLPPDEIPAKTEGYEGFYHLSDMRGDVENAVLSYIIRDHDKAKFEQKKQNVLDICQKLNEKYGQGTVEVAVKDSYYNMSQIIAENKYIIERAEKAMLDCGVQPFATPIRGGTDGATLSFKGLPCPNLCTGGANFHSRFEFVSIDAMEKITEILVKLITNIAE